VGATTNSRILANPLRISAAVPVPAGLETVGAVPGNGFKISSTVGPAIWEDVASLDATGAACSALPPGSLNGKLGLIRRGGCNFSVKILNAFLAGALAAVLYNNQLSQPPVPMDVGTSTQIAAVMIGNSEGVALKQFLSTAGPGVQGTIEAGRAAISVTPNRIVSFSSAGPSTDFGIKPDLVAPGANIYSAEQQNDPSGVQFNESGFGVASGTSFSSPMVAGAAAVVKQAFPNFTPAQIKSALVNTAAKQVSSVQGDFAGVLSQGNGLLDLDAALGAAATVSPASISFGARPPGSVLLTTTNLSITNGRSAAETFSITATRTVGSDKLTVSASPTSFTVAAGDSQAVTIVARSDDPLTGNVEGFLTIQGQNSQRPLTVPYWGTFLLPSASSEGVVNGASFARGSVAPGSLISIFGTDLVNSAESSLVIPLPASLGGAQVTIGGRAVALLDALPKQLNVQVPVELRGRTSANLEIRLNGIAGAPVTIPLSAAQPGLFSLTQDGKGPGAILHASNHALVTASNPARRGEFLEVYATGLGSVSPVVATGIPGSSNPVSRTDILPTATVGSVAAAVDFSGLAPAFVGLYQVNIVVPPGAAAGQQPLVLTSNGVASNPVTVFIAP
jgi:uncharacterized protein (TIGR03437 family)